jgi:ribosome-binding protein aMBF1 (putative translation factor)
MTQCNICKKTDDETVLNQGIYEGAIIYACKLCAKIEGIPLIKKPKDEQIELVERSASVRERLENMSKQDEKTKTLSEGQETANNNLANIKFPQKKQESDSLVENYYWKIQHARRLKKLSLQQASQETGISIEAIEELEKGQLSKNFESVAKILEEFYNIEVLRKKQTSEEIGKQENIKESQAPKKYNPSTKEFSYSNSENLENQEEKTIEQKEKKQELKQQISSGKFDFSKRENLKDVNLNDIIEMKREKEKQQQKQKEKKEHDDLLGRDIEL